MDQGFGTPGGTSNQWFPVRKTKKNGKFLKFCFNMTPRNSCQNHCPMVRNTNLRCVLLFFGKSPLGKSCKNNFPMVRATQNIRSCFVFKQIPSGSHENTTFRASLLLHSANLSETPENKNRKKTSGVGDTQGARQSRIFGPNNLGNRRSFSSLFVCLFVCTEAKFSV